jgi:hypothetical protein
VESQHLLDISGKRSAPQFFFLEIMDEHYYFSRPNESWMQDAHSLTQFLSNNDTLTDRYKKSLISRIASTVDTTLNIVDEW